MKEKDLDNLLALLELNEKKVDVLNKLTNLELNMMEDKEEYYDLVDIYKIICSSYNKRLRKVEEIEKDELVKKIIEFNPITKKVMSFQDSLYLDKKTLSFKRILVDLGCNMMNLYKESPDSESEVVNYLYSLLGLTAYEKKPNKIDAVAINNYMCFDFTNVLITEINRFLSSGGSKDFRRFLLELKYNLILFAPNIEQRAIINNFSFPDEARLTDEHMIHSAGMEEKEYLDKLDSVIAGWLEELINFCLYQSNLNEKPIRLIDLVFIKALSQTLNDKEILELITVDVKNVHSNNYKIASDLIKKTLEESKINSFINEKRRTYSRI